MKITKNKFVFTGKNDPIVCRFIGSKIYLEGKGEMNYAYVSKDAHTCKVGAKLYKWLGQKNQKVKITIEKVGK